MQAKSSSSQLIENLGPNEQYQVKIQLCDIICYSNHTLPLVTTTNIGEFSCVMLTLVLFSLYVYGFNEV